MTTKKVFFLDPFPKCFFLQYRTLGEGLVVLLVGILGVTGRLKAFACSGSLAGQ